MLAKRKAANTLINYEGWTEVLVPSEFGGPSHLTTITFNNNAFNATGKWYGVEAMDRWVGRNLKMYPSQKAAMYAWMDKCLTT